MPLTAGPRPQEATFLRSGDRGFAWLARSAVRQEKKVFLLQEFGAVAYQVLLNRLLGNVRIR